MGFFTCRIPSLALVLMALTAFGFGLRVVQKPQPFTHATKELSISCIDDEPAYLVRYIFSIQIVRHIEDGPIAIIHVPQELKMTDGIRSNMKAEGHIMKSNTSCLTLIIDKPDRQDAGTYRCQMFYLDEDFQMVEKNVIGNVTYQEQDITRVVTHLTRKVSSLLTTVLKQENALRAQKKQNVFFKDVHSKQKQDIDILSDKIDTENKTNMKLTIQVNKQNTLIDKLAKQIDTLKKDNTQNQQNVDMLIDYIRQQNETIEKYERKQMCPHGWSLYQEDKQCLKTFGKHNNNTHVTWSKAREECQALGGDLVQIRDENKNTFVYNMSNGAHFKDAWIGIKNTARYGYNFKYVDGSDLGSYHPWVSGDPEGNTAQDHKCVYMYSPPSQYGIWYDYLCTYKTAYVCSITPMTVLS